MLALGERFALVAENGLGIVLNGTYRPEKWGVGGAQANLRRPVLSRLIRRVDDRGRSIEGAWTLTGTERVGSEAEAMALLTVLDAWAWKAGWVVRSGRSASLSLHGGGVATATPAEGADSSIVTVTLHLHPTEDTWRLPDGSEVFS